MGKQNINNGLHDNDLTAETIRSAFDKVNSNFSELYNNLALGGSIKSVDQPISMIGAVSGDPETKQVADAINARNTTFEVPLGSTPLVSSYLPYNEGGITRYLNKKLYILTTGAGIYGTGGNITVIPANVIIINHSSVLPDSTIDLGDIGLSAISTALNNSPAPEEKSGLTTVTAIQNSIPQIYILDAEDGTYGSAGFQTSSDDFINLNTEPELYKNLSDGAIEPSRRSVDVTISLADLGRTNSFTQTAANILLDTDANLFIENGSELYIHFSGGGSHTITAPATSVSFVEDDLVYIQKIGDDEWLIVKLGKTVSAGNTLFGDYLQLTVGLPDPSYAPGRIFWDEKYNTVAMYTDIPGVTAGDSKIIVKVYNNSLVLITKGTPIHVGHTAVGDLLTVSVSTAVDLDNVVTHGLAAHDIPGGSEGYMITNGLLPKVNTSAFSPGDVLYVSELSGFPVSIEQRINKPVAIVQKVGVLDGELLVSIGPVIEPIGVGQAISDNSPALQAITSTPQPFAVYSNDTFKKNMLVTQIGTNDLTAVISPASIGLTGYYQAGFSCSLSSTTNGIITFELYIKGVASGLKGTIDLSNASTDAGSISTSVITKDILTFGDGAEIFVSSNNPITINVSSAVFSLKRIGNI